MFFFPTGTFPLAGTASFPNHERHQLSPHHSPARLFPVLSILFCELYLYTANILACCTVPDRPHHTDNIIYSVLLHAVYLVPTIYTAVYLLRQRLYRLAGHIYARIRGLNHDLLFKLTNLLIGFSLY